MSSAFLVIGPGGESLVLKKKMLELMTDMWKHLAEDSFNADDTDACSNVWVML